MYIFFYQYYKRSFGNNLFNSGHRNSGRSLPTDSEIITESGIEIDSEDNFMLITE